MCLWFDVYLNAKFEFMSVFAGKVHELSRFWGIMRSVFFPLGRCFFFYLVSHPTPVSFEIWKNDFLFANGEDILFASCKKFNMLLKSYSCTHNLKWCSWYVAPLISMRLRVRALSGSISFFVLFVVWWPTTGFLKLTCEARLWVHYHAKSIYQYEPLQSRSTYR